MSEGLLTFDDDNFQSEVLQAEGLVLVDFWAEWCGPCKALTPIITQLAEQVAGKAKVGKLNVDLARNTAMEYGISAIPTLLFFKNGEIVHKTVGMTSLKDLKAAVEQHA
jgi:thioredoxin 1